MYHFEDTNLPMKKVKLMCPNCQANLMIGEAVNNFRTGTQKRIFSFDSSHNWFDWEEESFECNLEDEIYLCAKCNTDVSTVLKNYI